MRKLKIIFVALIALSLAILILGRSYRPYCTNTRPDGKYSVHIFEIVRPYEWRTESGYHDALIEVRDGNGRILKRMHDSPATMCQVIWDEKGVLVGGAYCEFGK